jgi:hypothetical protein
MRTKDLFPSKYLQSADAKARQIVTTISYMALEEVGQDQNKKKKPVLHFEDQKPMVLNRTNAEMLEDAFGDSDDWPGHRIKIFCVRTQFQGKTVDGLRIEPIKPKPALKDELNDELPGDLKPTDDFGGKLVA